MCLSHFPINISYYSDESLVLHWFSPFSCGYTQRREKWRGIACSIGEQYQENLQVTQTGFSFYFCLLLCLPVFNVPFPSEFFWHLILKVVAKEGVSTCKYIKKSHHSESLIQINVTHKTHVLPYHYCSTRAFPDLPGDDTPGRLGDGWRKGGGGSVKETCSQCRARQLTAYASGVERPLGMSQSP